MKINYIALAIPFFFILIGIEVLAARHKQKELYRTNDSINDLSCGVLQQTVNIFLKSLLVAGYIYFFENYRQLEISADQTWIWLMCFVGVDFFYYWFHRFGHQINAFWATHIVHHQSEEYNLSVALRQGTFQNSVSWVFYLPLALVGFPPVMFLTLSSFNTLYQFWIHTRLVGKLGPLELVFNTPSHHRVHHGKNPEYIDKNHAGTLIIWDRMFGTFVEEKEEPVYGITKPLASWNPLWANFHYWVELFELSKKCHGLDKLRVLWKPPGWQPEYLGGRQLPPPITEAAKRKFDLGGNSNYRLYVLFQFVPVGVLLTAMLLYEEHLPQLYLVLGAVWILLSLLSFGAIFESRSWYKISEITRIVLAGVGVLILHTLNIMVWAVVAVGLVSWVWFMRTPADTPALALQKSA